MSISISDLFKKWAFLTNDQKLAYQHDDDLIEEVSREYAAYVDLAEFYKSLFIEKELVEYINECGGLSFSWDLNLPMSEAERVEFCGYMSDLVRDFTYNIDSYYLKVMDWQPTKVSVSFSFCILQASF
ncbi:MAG: hypothetical protein K1X81_10170 [Bacteroidia bacterium]|nr:hypothetical protein [Bacteroidia bacterium]